MVKNNENLDLECFFIGIEIYKYPQKQLRFSEILTFLMQWIGNEDNVSELEREYTNDECTIMFTLIPKKNRARDRELIQMEDYPFKIIDFSNIKKKLLKKCNKYGKIDKSYIIAINIINPFFKVNKYMLDLLLGEPEYIYDQNTKKVTKERKRNGIWRSKSKPRYTRNSGILVFEELRVYTFNDCRKIYYPNLWAANPYHGKLENIDHYKFSDGNYVCEKGDGFPKL